jgi:beta-phosphoglucomutase family hydrolase
MDSFNKYGFIFDMDGTLVDNMDHHSKAWGKLLDENGLEMDLDDFLKRTAGQTSEEIIPAVFGDISDERITEIADRKEELYRDAYRPDRKPVPGLVEFLASAKQLGIKMAVATAGPNANMEFILDGLDLRQYFDAITTARDVKQGKPDPEIFLMSAEKLGVEPANCVVFEDAIGGFEAAHRAGMRSVGIATVNPVEDISKHESVMEAHLNFIGLDPRSLVEKYLDTDDPT